MQPVPGQKSYLLPKNIGELSLFCDLSNNMDKSIALRKWVRICTKHPICKFISYNSLSPSYRVFVLFVFSVFIPQGWREALRDPK